MSPVLDSPHVPDILDCLAQLSNDEVPTPPKIAREVLDILPDELWADPELKWLDPFCKSGAFLREIVERLLHGLADWEPDFEKRRNHVFRNMVFGAAITEMTGNITRRTVYCSRDASGEHSVMRFDTEAGNLPFVPAEHDFKKGRCQVCGAPEDLDRGESRENYAYAFIHGAYPTKEMDDMKFDVIVGNPPYQIDDAGHNASATPVYQHFVEKAIALDPSYVLMITPSRWFIGGKGLDKYRARMLGDRRISHLVDYPKLYDGFPGVKIRGGVSYFLWDREHDGPCSIQTMWDGKPLGEPVTRYLDAYDVLVRRNEAVGILEKVRAYRVNGEPESVLDARVSSQKPFGLRTYFHGAESPDGMTDPVMLHGSQKRTWIERNDVPKNVDWIDEWKVLMSRVQGTSAAVETQFLGRPIVSGPKEACTESYVVAGRFSTQEEAERYAMYLRTRFARFLASLRKATVGKDDEPWERVVGQTRRTGEGLIKVGYTTKATARARIKQQLGTAYPNLEGVEILLDEPAVRADHTEFSDHEVHLALVKNGIKRPEGEWFEARIEEIRAAINSVKSGGEFDATRTESFEMRPEQAKAVQSTTSYFRQHAGDTQAPKFLWNAKMRFGKTFATYQLAKEMGWTRVLVLTYKPAVQSAWADDLLSHVDFAGWHFVDRETPIKEADTLLDGSDPVVRFASFQDLNGKSTDGQVKAHNESIHLTDWDCIVLDEYHFGAWRDSARELYDPTDARLAEEEEPDDWVTEEDLGLDAAHYLYLSGTPFRAITNGEFTEDATFNWTYVDEQAAKESWDEAKGPSPYAELPRMEMYTYEMGPGAGAYADDGEFSAFSLSEYFRAKKVDKTSRSTGPGSHVFEDPARVSEFLEMLRGKLTDQMKAMVLVGQKAPFPYESPVFTDAIKHSVWYMPQVASCFAMRDMLDQHPYFSGFEVVVAAGSQAGQGADAKPPVDAAIGKATKDNGSGSITLTCGKLMTGVTVREWGAILMLRSLKAPESYFQAAFRVQSPWAYRDAEGHLDVLKETCYVFEFDPNRALSLVAEYGIRLASEAGATPHESIGQLLNYLPIFGFSGGSMEQLDASSVLDWATAGIGATALAKRWNSPLLVDVNERTLLAVLDHPGLLDTLAQIEDFRALVNNAEQVITSTTALKKAKREQGGKLDPEQRREQSETAKQRKEIREKLQKFLAKIPVFMYVTDFREEALKHVIESLDSTLFERVTGLTIEDFKLLSDLGLFNARHMDAAIYQFRQFERASLRYADDRPGEEVDSRVGLWDRSVDIPGQT